MRVFSLLDNRNQLSFSSPRQAWLFSSTSIVHAVWKPSHTTMISPLVFGPWFVPRISIDTHNQTNNFLRHKAATFLIFSSMAPLAPARKHASSPPSASSTVLVSKRSRSIPVFSKPAAIASSNSTSSPQSTTSKSHRRMLQTMTESSYRIY